MNFRLDMKARICAAPNASALTAIASNIKLCRKIIGMTIINVTSVRNIMVSDGTVPYLCISIGSRMFCSYFAIKCLFAIVSHASRMNEMNQKEKNKMICSCPIFGVKTK